VGDKNLYTQNVLFCARHFPVGEALKRHGIQRGDVRGQGVGHDRQQGGSVAQLGEDLALSLPENYVSQSMQETMNRSKRAQTSDGSRCIFPNLFGTKKIGFFIMKCSF